MGRVDCLIESGLYLSNGRQRRVGNMAGKKRRRLLYTDAPKDFESVGTRATINGFRVTGGEF